MSDNDEGGGSKGISNTIGASSSSGGKGPTLFYERLWSVAAKNTMLWKSVVLSCKKLIIVRLFFLRYQVEIT